MAHSINILGARCRFLRKFEGGKKRDFYFEGGKLRGFKGMRGVNTPLNPTLERLWG